VNISTNTASAAGAHDQWPTDPITAATHPNPYPYYAQLAAERPFYHDEGLGLWVASSVAAVEAVLTSDSCRVRPPAEPVPKTIAGSPAGEIFRHLVRQNDGENHCPFKRAILATLGGIDIAHVAHIARDRARVLGADLAPEQGGDALTGFIFALPVQTMAIMFGVPDALLGDVAAWVNAFVLSFSPVAAAAEIDEGKTAAGRLLDLFRTLFGEADAGDDETLLRTLARHAHAFGRADDAIIANGIGFLSQSYEATAGLIGNALLALRAHHESLPRCAHSPNASAPSFARRCATIRRPRARGASWRTTV
jgi:cytochrome P450